MNTLNDTHSVGLLCTRDRTAAHLTTHNPHKRRTSMPPAGFDPATPARERPQTHALARLPESAMKLIMQWHMQCYSQQPTKKIISHNNCVCILHRACNICLQQININIKQQFEWTLPSSSSKTHHRHHILETRNQLQVLVVKFSFYDLKRPVSKVAVIAEMHYKRSHAG
jgi:hypothetical protein